MKKIPLPLYLSVLALIWFGLVAGISFLEAPLKFQAPNITLALGLGIGRLVFGALNKIELLLAAGMGMLVLFRPSSSQIRLLVAILYLLLAAQTAWLLPFLDARAETIIQGHVPPPSHLHFVYVAFEAIKLVLLLTVALRNLKHHWHGIQN